MGNHRNGCCVVKGERIIQIIGPGPLGQGGRPLVSRGSRAGGGAYIAGGSSNNQPFMMVGNTSKVATA